MRGCQAVIVASRLADERLWAEVLNLGGYDLLAKPFDRDELVRVIAMAARHSAQKHARRSSARSARWPYPAPSPDVGVLPDRAGPPGPA